MIILFAWVMPIVSAIAAAMSMISISIRSIASPLSGQTKNRPSGRLSSTSLCCPVCRSLSEPNRKRQCGDDDRPDNRQHQGVEQRRIANDAVFALFSVVFPPGDHTV